MHKIAQFQLETPSLAKAVNDHLSQQRDPQLRNKLKKKPVPALELPA